MSSLPTALAGIDQARTRIEKVARAFATLPVSEATGDTSDSVDLSAEAISLLEAQTACEVNIKTAQAADAMTKQSLDLLA